MNSSLKVLVKDKFAGAVYNVPEPPNNFFMYDGSERFITRIYNGVVALPYPGQLNHRNLQMYLRAIAEIKADLVAGCIHSHEYCLLVLAEIARQETNYCGGVLNGIGQNHGDFWNGQAEYDDERQEYMFETHHYLTYKEDEIEEIDVTPMVDPLVVWSPVFEVTTVLPQEAVEVKSPVSAFDLSKKDREFRQYTYRIHPSQLDAYHLSKNSIYTLSETTCGAHRRRKGSGVFGSSLICEGVESNPGPVMYTKKRDGTMVAHYTFQVTSPPGSTTLNVHLPTYTEIESSIYPLGIYDPHSMYYVLDISVHPVQEGMVAIDNGKKTNVYNVVVDKDNLLRYSTRPTPILRITFPEDHTHCVVSGMVTVKSRKSPRVEVKRGKRPTKKIFVTYECEGYPNERVMIRKFNGESPKEVVKEIRRTETKAQREARKKLGDPKNLLEPGPGESFDETISKWEDYNAITGAKKYTPANNKKKSKRNKKGGNRRVAVVK